MNGEEKRQLVEQIGEYGKTLIQGIRVMDERRHILKPMLRNEEIKEALYTRFENTDGALAFNHLVPLLVQDLLRDLARLFLDEGSNAGSFRNLFRKASNPKIFPILQEHFTQIPDSWGTSIGAIEGLTAEETERWIESHRQEERESYGHSFHEGWLIAQEGIEALNADPVAEKIRTARDKFVAHLQMTPLGEEPGPFDVSTLELTFLEILEFPDRYMEPAIELSRVVSGNVYSQETFSRIHRRRGENMWRVLAGLPEVRRGADA